jgi:hypothetical protein
MEWFELPGPNSQTLIPAETGTEWASANSPDHSESFDDLQWNRLPALANRVSQEGADPNGYRVLVHVANGKCDMWRIPHKGAGG